MPCKQASKQEAETERESLLGGVPSENVQNPVDWQVRVRARGGIVLQLRERKRERERASSITAYSVFEDDPLNASSRGDCGVEVP